MYNSVRIYRLKDFDHTEEDLSKALAEHKSRDPEGMEKSTIGWGSPFAKHSDELIHSVMGIHRITFVTTERILPKPAVDCVVEDKIEEFVEEYDREPEKKEIGTIRNAARDSMIPKAFIRRKRLNGVIDTKGGYLFVLTAAGKKADDFTSLLRKSLGSLKAYPLETTQAVQPIMTRWIRDAEMPRDLEAGEKCTLVDKLNDPDCKNPEIKFNHADAGNRDVSRLLEDGMEITALGVQWRNTFNLSINSDLVISGIKGTDFFTEKADEKVTGAADTEEGKAYRAHADSMLLIYGEYFRSLSDDILQWFGGEADYAKLAEERHGIKEVPVEEKDGADQPVGFKGKPGADEEQEEMFCEDATVESAESDAA